MVGETLAAAGMGGSIGYVVGLFLLPALGLLLLILGVRRSRASQALQPPWPQPGPPAYPPGYHPPQHGPLVAPPGFYPPPPPPPPPLGPPPKQSAGGTVMIVVGCVLMVLGLLGAGVMALGATDDATSTGARPSGAPPSPSTPDAADGLQVGQCITDQQYASAEMSPEPTDCGERDAVYELASHGSGPSATCPDGLREDSGYAVLFNSSTTFCFVLNVGEGECFYVDPDAQLFSPVDCTDPMANSKIDKIFDGTDDLSRCPAGPQGAAFPEPARTYCVVPPD